MWLWGQEPVLMNPWGHPGLGHLRSSLWGPAMAIFGEHLSGHLNHLAQGREQTQAPAGFDGTAEPPL